VTCGSNVTLLCQVEANQLLGGRRICEFDLKKNKKVEINQLYGVGTTRFDVGLISNRCQPKWFLMSHTNASQF